jgi:hypothetical protein
MVEYSQCIDNGCATQVPMPPHFRYVNKKPPPLLRAALKNDKCACSSIVAVVPVIFSVEFFGS